MTLVINGSSLSFRVSGQIKIGFSDTLWYGADHFNRCRHLAGLRAVVQYLPSSTPTISGELLQLDVYDDEL